MASETLQFDIIGNSSSATKAFKDTAEGAALASKAAKDLSDRLAVQSKTAQVTAAATLSLVKSDQVLADAELVLAGRADEASFALKKQGDAADEAAVKTGVAGEAAKDAGGGFGAMASPMGAAIGAGVALAPVLLTVATGLGGLGVAGYGIVSPILQAAGATGGLAKNMSGLSPVQQQMGRELLTLEGSASGFAKSLQPEVLALWGDALGTAGGLLHDVQPVAKATGDALHGVLQGLGATFNDTEWRSFFNFMASTAGPDTQLLGDNLQQVLTLLPPLLTDLQPLATELLTTSDGALKLADGGVRLYDAVTKTGDASQQSAGFISQLGDAVKHGAADVIPGVAAQRTLAGVFEDIAGSSGKAATGVSGLTLPVSGLAVSASVLAANAKADEVAISGTAAAAAAASPPVSQLADDNFVLAQNAGHAADSVTQLNSAWSAFLSLSTSLETAQIGVEGDLATLAKDAAVAGASFTGVNAASQKLQSGFESSLVPGLENVIGGMRRAGASSSDLASVLATDLKPAVDRGALSNKALEQQVYDLAVQAGYTGPNALKPLKAWIDANATSAWAAKAAVDQWGASLAKLPSSEHLQVLMTGTGTYKIVNSATGQVYGGGGHTLAAGGFISGGVPGRDSVPAMLMPGEVVVPTSMVNAGAVDHLRGSIPGFASGGVAGSAPSFVQGMHADFAGRMGATEAAAIAAGVREALAAAAALASAGYIPGTPATGSAAAAQAFALSILPAGWSWPALQSLWQRESGWSAWAVNPSSGAYGIPQSLGHGHPYNLGDYANQVRWGISYIAGRYGNSQNAWAHEVADNWYGNGLDAVFSRPSVIGVGERGPERVQVTPLNRGSGGTGDVHIHVHNHGVIGSQAEVRSWLNGEIDALARQGRLSWALRNSPSAG